MRATARAIAFDDAVQGRIAQDVAREVGDFVLRRADGYWAYQLAVVVDDAAQGITDVVRGADLLDSTPRQILLQRALGLPTPRYAHLPLVARWRRAQAVASHERALPVDDADPLPGAARGLARAGPGRRRWSATTTSRNCCDGAVRSFRPAPHPAHAASASPHCTTRTCHDRACT